MLLLEHKQIGYRVIELPTGAHPILVRLAGFPGHSTRTVDGHTNGGLTMINRFGTVPALRLGGERAQTNREIARLLERVQPEPPLFPAGPLERARVEEAEEWGDEVLQMASRRLVLAAAARGGDELHDRGASGRLGALLARSGNARAYSSRTAARLFEATPEGERELFAELPAMLDRIDRWIGEGVLDGAELNAADYMIAPCVALLSYRNDLGAEIAARPVGALVDRVLPLP
jgi:glutathione S-transferase